MLFTLPSPSPGSEWLYEAIRISFRSHESSILASSLSSTNSTTPSPPRDPRFAKLIQELRWSKQFILTYQLVVVIFIVSITAIHWYTRLTRWRTRRSKSAYQVTVAGPHDVSSVNIDDDEVSSSGSSTLQGHETPPRRKPSNEATPLLRGSPYQPASIGSWITSFLLYQPRPIPVVHKILPSNGTSLLVLLFLAIQFFYLFYRINFTWFELFVFADRAGLVFAMNLPILYLLAAKTSVLRICTGYSYESLNLFHRRLGEVMCFVALLHALGMVGVWYTLFSSSMSFIRFLLEKIVLLGTGAFFAYEVLYLTSLTSFRQRWYELFLGLHIVLQAAGLILLFFHHSALRLYVGAALAIFLIDRVLYRVCVKSRTYSATALVMEDLETVRLTTDIPLHRAGAFQHFFQRSVDRGWKATDHVYLSCPTIRSLQAHPFTIASPAPIGGESTKLELLIRAQDGFSAELVREAASKSSLKIRLDGPYGGAHARHLVENSDVSILVAGGSGIAVCWPLVHHLLDIHKTQDQEQGRVGNSHRIILIWVVHRSSHLSWLGDQQLNEVKSKGVEVIVPPATAQYGRPDLEIYIKNVVDLINPDTKIGIVGSGPDSMGRTVRNAVSRLARRGRNVDVVIEKFGW